MEGRSVDCTCNGAVGQPEGRLQWILESDSGDTTQKSGVYGVTTLELTLTVNRYNHGNKLRCDVDWATDVTGPDHELLVAWGPDSVNIPTDPTFYTDSTGSKTMTLTCNGTEANPPSALTYHWNIPCEGQSGSTCSFKPRPPGSGSNGDVNDGDVITCTVTNTLNDNKAEQDSITLDLKYPPSSPPIITGYVNNQPLYQDDSLTLTCNVNGGDPTVTSVSLTCPGQHEQNATPGKSSNLTIPSLSPSDNNLTCVCSGRWVRQDYYTMTDSRTLTVYYPPSTPTISRTDLDPPIEGDTVTLTCYLTSAGNPPARLTWPSEERSKVEVNPLMMMVTRGDNLRNVTCQASNAFTEERGGDNRAEYTLHVYYGPYITFQAGVNDNCEMTSGDTSCHVTEGQRVRITCDVDSNPDPKDCTWSVVSGSGSLSDLGMRPDLDLMGVSRSDSGVYQVHVQTEKPDSGDGRLPLEAQRNLTVLVKYHPTDTTFTANNEVNITVTENNRVTLECQSQGRPTPQLRLIQRDQELAREDGGRMSLLEETSHLIHIISARCDNTGVIFCRADNSVGSQEWAGVQLYVTCKPHSTEPTEEVPSVNFRTKSVSVSFKMEAFPLPDRHSFSYLGTSQNSASNLPVPDSITLSATCSNTYADFAVTCNVSVDLVTDKTAEGFYSFTAANDFDAESFVFQVRANASSEPSKDDSSATIGIGGAVGITLAVVVVIDIIIIIWMWRRNWILPCAGKGGEQHTSGDNRQRLEANEAGPPSVNPRQDDVYEIAMDRLSHQPVDHQSPTYSSLDTSDIGVPSVYTAMSHYRNAAPARDQDDQSTPEYLSLVPGDNGDPSVHTAMSPYRNAAPAREQDPDYEISKVERKTTYENVIGP